MQLEEEVDAYLGEWLRGIAPADASKDWYLNLLKGDHVSLSIDEPNNWVSAKGNDHLRAATRLLLDRTKEQRRVTTDTARRCLIEAHFAHLPKAMRTRKLSEHAVIAGATDRLTKARRSNGTHVIPVCFAPSATKTSFRIGPAVIFARAVFEERYRSAIQARADDDDAFTRKAVKEWAEYSKRYDHFIVVRVDGHESEMAWKAARDVAEYVLNLVRLKFGYHHMDDVRIGNGFIWETSQVKVFFSEGGAAGFTLSSGPWASHLDDTWGDHFEDDFGPDAPLLASLAMWMVSGDDPSSPVLERLRYANTLIAEAFSEPHDRIRLVRLVAALEALAVLHREDKSEGLAWRCAFAGGWTDCGRAVQIVEDVLYAYSVRNAVVHGDGPNEGEAISAFYRLERNLVPIYLGFLRLHARTQACYRPTHIRHIRQAFDRHIESFFWTPDEVW